MSQKPTPTPPAPETEKETAAGDEYTIDELAAFTRVPSRTVRFYQAKGALARPEIKGRVAYYNESHVERLKLIASLQDRGLRIDAIRDLVGRIDKGELDVNEWLGLEAQLQAPWANDQPRAMNETELFEFLGARRPGIVAFLLGAKLVKRHGDAYFVRSPGLLQLALKLETAGVDLETAVGAAEILRKHMGRSASELAEHFVKNASDAFSARGDGGDVAATFRELRPMALEAVRLIFSQEMERVLRKLVESGKAATLPAKGRAGSAAKRGRTAP